MSKGCFRWTRYFRERHRHGKTNSILDVYSKISESNPPQEVRHLCMMKCFKILILYTTKFQNCYHVMLFLFFSFLPPVIFFGRPRPGHLLGKR